MWLFRPSIVFVRQIPSNYAEESLACNWHLPFHFHAISKIYAYKKDFAVVISVAAVIYSTVRIKISFVKGLVKKIA